LGNQVKNVPAPTQDIDSVHGRLVLRVSRLGASRQDVGIEENAHWPRSA
jgi:hypothetical protein